MRWKFCAGLNQNSEREDCQTKGFIGKRYFGVGASEVKRRKEAAEVFTAGNRAELAQKELSEAVILKSICRQPCRKAELKAIIEQTIAENNYTAKDFGAAMGKLKVSAWQRR